MSAASSPAFPALLRLLLAVALSAETVSLRAQVPAGGVEMIQQTNPGDAGYYTGDGPVTSREIIAVSGQGFTQATRVATINPTGQFYASAVTFTSDRAVADGDIILWHFFARMEETMDESGTAVMEVYVEGPAPTYTRSTTFRVNVAGAWQEFFIPFAVVGDHAAGELGFKFGLGATGRPQVIDFGGVAAFWYGTSRTLSEMPRTSFDYAGRAMDAPWRAEAAARIEEYRRGDYSIRLVDEEGMPAAGAAVRVRLVRHAFEFGSAMVASLITDSASMDAGIYRQKIRELFNSGTLENDTKWPPWIGDWGSAFNQPQTVAALEWTRQQGLTMRGHVLVWPSVRNLPAQIGDLVTARDPSVPGLIRDHIEDIMGTTAGHFTDWDVINEPFDNFDVMEVYGYDLMAEWFRTAGAQAAGVGLFLNDYGILAGGGLDQEKQDAYAGSLARIMADGGPITGVGFQGHFSGTPTGIPRVWEILQRYAREFPDLDMRITEFDITGTDEELKADYLRDFYTIAFSHPQMRGVQMWGFWEEAHWRSESALYHADWSERPLGQAYRELVHETWRTNEVMVAGADGMMTGRGFKGEYVVETLSGQYLGAFSLLAERTGVENIVVGPESEGGRLSNLSTRARVRTGEEKMVAGFVIEGSGPQEVVIRAVGPGLAEHGIPAFLEDPAFSVFRAGETVPMLQVDDWGNELTEVFARLGAFELVNDATSAASRLRLDPGAYTVVVEGADNGTGVALVEVYDAAGGTAAQMVNLSTRGVVGTGPDIMVAGLVLEGEGGQRVLLRGVGPTLGNHGVTGALADPVLRLLQDQEQLESNQRWGAANNADEIRSAMARVGAFPLPDASADAALLVDLEPGIYTVELAGVDEGTGVGLIEVYRVP